MCLEWKASCIAGCCCGPQCVQLSAELFSLFFVCFFFAFVGTLLLPFFIAHTSLGQLPQSKREEAHAAESIGSQRRASLCVFRCTVLLPENALSIAMQYGCFTHAKSVSYVCCCLQLLASCDLCTGTVVCRLPPHCAMDVVRRILSALVCVVGDCRPPFPWCHRWEPVWLDLTRHLMYLVSTYEALSEPVSVSVSRTYSRTGVVNWAEQRW